MNRSPLHARHMLFRGKGNLTTGRCKIKTLPAESSFETLPDLQAKHFARIQLNQVTFGRRSSVACCWIICSNQCVQVSSKTWHYLFSVSFITAFTIKLFCYKVPGQQPKKRPTSRLFFWRCWWSASENIFVTFMPLIVLFAYFQSFLGKPQKALSRICNALFFRSMWWLTWPASDKNCTVLFFKYGRQPLSTGRLSMPRPPFVDATPICINCEWKQRIQLWKRKI